MDYAPTFLTYEQVAQRWHCHRATAVRRLTLAKFPVVRFNDASVALVRLTDLEKFEQARVELLDFGKFPDKVHPYKKASRNVDQLQDA